MIYFMLLNMEPSRIILCLSEKYLKFLTARPIIFLLNSLHFNEHWLVASGTFPGETEEKNCEEPVIT